MEEVDREVQEKKGPVRHKKGNNWQPCSYDRVCSEHFIEGTPTDEHPYPVLNMGHEKIRKKRRRSPKHRSPSHVRRVKRTKPEETDVSETENLDVTPENFDGSSADCVDSSPIPDAHDHEYHYKSSADCQSCFDKQMTINHLIERITELEERLQDEMNRNKRSQITKEKVTKAARCQTLCLRTDDQVRFYTGVPSVKMFDLLYSYVLPKVDKMRYWRGTKNTLVNRVRRFITSPKKSGGKRALSSKEEFLLILIKLRLGITNHDLADRFGVSP